MNALRSREVLPNLKSKAKQPLAKESAGFEPVTPLKTSELLSQLSKSTTPSSRLAAENFVGMELGSGSGSCFVLGGQSGSQLRRSARLASHVGMDGNLGSVGIVRKRKKRKVEGSALNGEFDSRNLEGGLNLESGERGEVHEGLLSLRSGKRVARGEKKDCGGAAGSGVEHIENGMDTDTVLSVKKEEKVHSGACSSDSESETSSEELAGTNTGAVLRRDDHSETSSDDSSSDSMCLPESADSEVLIKDKGTIETLTGVLTRGRLRKEEKGKMKLGVRDSSSTDNNTAKLKVENVEGSSSGPGTSGSASHEPLQIRGQVRERETDATTNYARRAYRERFRGVAKRNAFRFARFASGQEFGNDTPNGKDASLPQTDHQIEDWPGPFSTAMKIIRDRATNKQGDQPSSFSDKTKAFELNWIPKERELGIQQKQIPSLQELCWPILSLNSNAISSFDFIPVALRHQICWCLCDGRRMDGHILNMLAQDSPTEIRVRDCSWLSEDLFANTFQHCDTSKLTVLQLDQCGSCMPDYILYSTLGRSPNNLPVLTTISLRAAYRLSDTGLSLLVSCAPSLKSIDISQCPLVTAVGISSLANCQRSILRELYLDECQGVDAMLILPALLDLEKLEVLSVAGIPTVNDEFIIAFSIAHGRKIKELGLADCMELTDVSLKAIGDRCSELRAIDLTNLHKLTDVSIGHLANGCHGIWKLKLGRNRFSDEAVAAYLDLRGECLQDMTLNHVIQVSNHTALSFARNCRILRSLDLSWCRNVTNEALGLIVDSCLSLELLKLFGCTQVTNVFLDGHSNPHVKIIGLKMTPMLKHIDVPDFLLGPLRYSSSGNDDS